jgi:acetyltransferase-like isoleucine patch superfamily enzyme
MNKEKTLLKYAWEHKHMVYTYPLLRLAMISPFIGVNAFLHRIRGVSVGKEVKIAHDVLIDSGAPQDIILGDYVTISPRAVICAHTDTGLSETGTHVTIQEGSWIGAGALILPGVTIGKYCVIGAGAVVNQDIPDFTLALGVPAQPVRSLKKTYKIPRNATVTRVLVLEDEE